MAGAYLPWATRQVQLRKKANSELHSVVSLRFTLAMASADLHDLAIRIRDATALAKQHGPHSAAAATLLTLLRRKQGRRKCQLKASRKLDALLKKEENQASVAIQVGSVMWEEPLQHLFRLSWNAAWDGNSAFIRLKNTLY